MLWGVIVIDCDRGRRVIGGAIGVRPWVRQSGECQAVLIVTGPEIP
jgi:hypothetical protein